MRASNKGKDNGMRRRNVVKAAVLGAALALVVPGFAAATTSATVATPGTTSWTSPGADQLLKPTSAAHCSSGLISGGGVNVTGSGTAQQIDAIHVMETTPSNDGSHEEDGTHTDDPYWLGYGGTGNIGSGNYTVQPFGVCFTNSVINHTQMVVNSTSGPNSANATASVTATCPSGTRLLGGGAQSITASNGSVKVIGSFPSNSSGSAAADGSTNPTSWTAVALNGNQAVSGDDTTAYAVCSGSGIDVSGVTVTVKHTNVSGPTSADSSQQATSSDCGTDGNLISGGASISGGDPTASSFATPGSSGDHVNGDYPSSDSSGTPTSDGNSPSTWTAIGHTGGQSSSNTDTDVWGLCMN